MSVRRVFLTILGVVIIGLAAWLVMEWLARPGELPLGPLVALGIAALVGLALRLAPPRKPAEPARRQTSNSLDEIPRWLKDAQFPPEPRPTLDVQPPRLEESEAPPDPDAFPPDAPTRPVDHDVPWVVDSEPEPGSASEVDDYPLDLDEWFPDEPEPVGAEAPESVESEPEASADAPDDYPLDLEEWFADEPEPVESEAEPEPEASADAPDDDPLDLEEWFPDEPDSVGTEEPEPTRGLPRMEAPDVVLEPEWQAKEDEPSGLDEPDQPPDAPIQFSAYYPPEVRPDDWQPLKAYIYKEPAYQTVLADARARLGARDDIRETVAAALQPVPEGALVTAIPSVPGLEFDPPQASARFRRDWRRFDFEFQAVDALLDQSADGQITFFVEGVIVADVKLSVYVSRRAGRRLKPPQESSAKPYQAVFCSYSHKDTVIVARVERSSRMHFTKFLRDVTTLRSGERWNDRLLELIDEADIFQLFWSKPAAESKYVAQEWQYALALRDTGNKGRYFIRPVRWEEPMPVPPPPELADLHFDLIRELLED